VRPALKNLDNRNENQTRIFGENPFRKARGELAKNRLWRVLVLFETQRDLFLFLSETTRRKVPEIGFETGAEERPGGETEDPRGQPARPETSTPLSNPRVTPPN